MLKECNKNPSPFGELGGSYSLATNMRSLLTDSSSPMACLDEIVSSISNHFTSGIGKWCATQSASNAMMDI